MRGLNNTAHRQREGIVEWELFATDVESIEGIGAVGSVFEQIFFALGELFAGLVLAEVVAPFGDTG